MTQSYAIAHPHQVSSNPHRLAAFDFTFNGALDPVQVHEIATAAFVGRGENLLLVGGPGTGKTVIAMEVRQQADALGLTSEYLYSPGSWDAAWALVDHGPGFVGSRQARPGLLEGLLNCDVLLVDEVERWLEAAPVAFMVLLGRRIELGKSNILVVSSGGWKRLHRKEGTRRPSESCFNHPAFLLGTEPELHSEWGKLMVHDRFMALPQLLKVLGITFTLPAADGEAPEPVQSSISQSEYRRGPSPFAKAPVWHQLYTGENSYREILRRRG